MTTTTPSQPPSDDTQSIVIDTLLTLTPVSIFTLIIFILSYGLLQPSQLPNTRDTVRNIKHLSRLDQPSPLVPSLAELVADVADALDVAKVTHWLMPGLGLLPSYPQEIYKTNFAGHLNPWQEGVDLGVFHQDAMKILLAQASLQQNGIVAVESYFGLRLFHVSGRYDDRYDFRTPFVDIFYFRTQGDSITNACCDCGPVTIGPCTKKTCTCVECTFPRDQIFPLSIVQVDHVRRALNAPHNTSTLLLPNHLPGVHPSAFTTALPHEALALL